ncbi:MAG: histidinol-phosphate transaminase [Deltaproteobacteria bacterium]|nr:histidinol-phosphate transaminase [Deltaproteobacteria bacterium]
MLDPTARAIVLAAGTGSRLVNGGSVPKPLKPIAGVPLLVRILRTLQSEGVGEAVVVVGYRGDQIRRALERDASLALLLRFVDNPHFELKNGVSVLAARDFVAQGCLLTMADHLYSPELVRRVRSFALPAGSCVLGVDHDIERCFDLDDATKVCLEHGRIARIGKDIDGYNAIDTGVFRIGPGLVAELEQVQAQHGDCSLSDGVAALAASGRMHACDIGDARWIDVDTPEAAQRAAAMLHVFGDGLGDEPTGGGRTDPEAMELFAPSWVRGARPYDEEHFARAAERGDALRMMSNESPFRPSERVLEAILRAAMGANEYPNGARTLRHKLAGREGLSPEGVLLGAGSSELIDLAVRTYVAPGEEVLISVPTFSLFEARTRVAGGIPVMVPMTEEGELDVPALIAAITERTKLIFLCTPNNPTGNSIPAPLVRRLLRLGLPTVIDEAYCEFADEPTSLAYLLAEFPNALVLRTFSKAFGLAGLRLGYALGHPAQIRLLGRVKLPWNVSSVAVAAACAALDDVDEQRRRLRALREGRTFLERALVALPGVKVSPSQGNFVLVDAAGTGLAAEAIVERMLGRGIAIRSLRSHRAGSSLVRISVGDAEQNRRCAAAFRDVVLGALRARPAAQGEAARPE